MHHWGGRHLKSRCWDYLNCILKVYITNILSQLLIGVQSAVSQLKSGKCKYCLCIPLCLSKNASLDVHVK